MTILNTAKDIGFDVPEYFLAETTDDIDVDKYIIKPIAGNGILKFEEYYGVMYTSMVKNKEKEDFYITFFKEKD